MNTNHTFRYPAALTVAGSDSSGGAGIQADIKTFSALGVYAASVITAVTAQNTQGVRAVEAVSPSVLQAQLAAVWEDMRLDAVKIGMLYTSDAVRIVGEALDTFHPPFIVLDPVLLSTSGRVLLEEKAVTEMAKQLFPRISLLTPNLKEAEYLTGIPIRREADAEAAAARLLETGCPAVLIKGGHWGEENGRNERNGRKKETVKNEENQAYEAYCKEGEERPEREKDGERVGKEEWLEREEKDRKKEKGKENGQRIKDKEWKEANRRIRKEEPEEIARTKAEKEAKTANGKKVQGGNEPSEEEKAADDRGAADDGDEKVADLLFVAGQPPLRFAARRVLTRNAHGTGCTLSSAIAAYTALGYPLPAAVEAAKDYITAALSAGADVQTGRGHGPVNHFFNPLPLYKIKS